MDIVVLSSSDDEAAYSVGLFLLAQVYSQHVDAVGQAGDVQAEAAGGGKHAEALALKAFGDVVAGVCLFRVARQLQRPSVVCHEAAVAMMVRWFPAAACFRCRICPWR